MHGTPGAYTNHGCRCRECRDAWTAYNKENRRQRKARGICIQCPEPRFKQHVRCRAHHEALPKRTDRRIA